MRPQLEELDRRDLPSTLSLTAVVTPTATGGVDETIFALADAPNTGASFRVLYSPDATLTGSSPSTKDLIGVQDQGSKGVLMAWAHYQPDSSWLTPGVLTQIAVLHFQGGQGETFSFQAGFLPGGFSLNADPVTSDYYQTQATANRPHTIGIARPETSKIDTIEHRLERLEKHPLRNALLISVLEKKEIKLGV